MDKLIMSPISDLEEMDAELKVRAILDHLNLGGVLVRLLDYSYAFMRNKNRTFTKGFVDEHLREPGYLERVGKTYWAKWGIMYTLSEKGREAAGGVHLFGTVEMARRLKIVHDTVDWRINNDKLVPLARAGKTRVFCQWNVDEQNGKATAETKPEITIFKKSAVAKIAKMSIQGVDKHIGQRLLYGQVIGDQFGRGTMVFTKEQVVEYLRWMASKKNNQIVKWENRNDC
jgi:hypothetical protein